MMFFLIVQANSTGKFKSSASNANTLTESCYDIHIVAMTKCEQYILAIL